MEKLSSFTFDIGPIRPPSEGGSQSLLIRVTRNCPWNRCKFCHGRPYDRQKFERRSIDEIKADIQNAKRISDEIIKVSTELGHAGEINSDVIRAMVQQDPALNTSHSFITVINWMATGAGTAFLQDADSLVIKTPEMIEIIRFLKETFPSIKRITTYARAKTIYMKTLQELKDLRAAGLIRVHIGLESGDDDVLKYVEKGVTAEQHIIAGKRAKEAGLQVSAYVMPGLGGRKWSEQHARNTARVLNEINPNYIRSRALIPGLDTPLCDDYLSGEFELTSPHERLRELKIMIEALDVTSHVCFDHFMNTWRNRSGEPLFTQDYEGYKFPEEKQKVLQLIEVGLSLSESVHIHAKELMRMQL